MEHAPVDVVVIGAGQAGLSAGYHLRRRGFVRSRVSTAARRRRRHVRGAGRQRAAGWSVAAPLALAEDGDRERHPRAPRLPGAAGRGACGEQGRPPAVLRRLRGGVRPRRAAPGAGDRSTSRRCRSRRATARGDGCRSLGSRLRDQRDRNLDAAVLAALPGTVPIPRPPAARRRLRVGGRVRRTGGW